MKASPLFVYVKNRLTEVIVSLYENRDTLTDAERVKLETEKEVLTKIDDICQERGRY